MRQEKLLIPTLREAPSEAEAISHQLLLRAGFIRQVAAGIYTYLPLGLRVLRKVSAIVREEMELAGVQEILMPAMQPAELWHESGRYEVYGQELIRFQDRHQREFVLGPTHEEVITALVRNEVNSYRKLPLTLYQIQTKFRDERRPRFGLLRGREFLMKDAYSFDSSWEGLDSSYRSMYDAYCRIFARCGLNYRPVEADAGAIGGEGGTHEFMALADIGEDTVVSCMSCDYAANLEKAEGHSGEADPSLLLQVEGNAEAGSAVNKQGQAAAGAGHYDRLHTPDTRTIQELAQSTGMAASSFVKTLIYLCDENYIAVLVRGDHEVNEIKVKHALDAENLVLADAAAIEAITGAPTGFAGPIGLSIPILVDRSVAAMKTVIVGANEQDYHLRNVQPGRDFSLRIMGDYRNATEGDCCPRCGGGLVFHRGIEVGQVFKLGTKYSEKLDAKFLDSTGREQLMIMGCYGIGISRILSAVVEQHHDSGGILWPNAIAPFYVHLIMVSVKDTEQVRLAEELYRQLKVAGVEVLLDDRDERPGVKFKDSDLIGIPIRITVGRQAAEGLVEYRERRTAEQIVISADTVVAKVTG
ncbi:Proline--tRNA ligase [Paenibacillus plantiphilus]|uniref:Proline--tRNA ligase n=1 Tax=Paenibacillus plantiphilus TaxID=2905650 RepID=A0ABM9CT34_9BACL|nr:proline--tRNA ligase [Paenibacillus plantiphilus]CAH1221944.1 Proline--tRNA ligase [Paenibacillus plantiphilus]